VLSRGVKTRIGLTLAGTVFVAVLACVVQAYAWEVSKSSNGLMLTRSEDDTRTATVNVYRDPKALTSGQSWAEYQNTGSYDTAGPAMTFNSWIKGVDIPRQFGSGTDLGVKDGFNLVVIKYGGITDEALLVYVDPARVAVTAPVSVAGTLPVTLSGDTSVTVSADSTLPVQVAGVAGLSDTDFGLVLVLLGGVLGFAAYRGLGAVWGVHRD